MAAALDGWGLADSRVTSNVNESSGSEMDARTCCSCSCSCLLLGLGLGPGLGIGLRYRLNNKDWDRVDTADRPESHPIRQKMEV